MKQLVQTQGCAKQNTRYVISDTSQADQVIWESSVDTNHRNQNDQ